MELVLIPGGTFTVGSPPGEHGRHDREGPQHEVTLSSFYMARTPVTNAQYALYREVNPEVPKPPDWQDEQFNQPEQPVVALTWHEAKAYCDWAGLELPTEAQWEYAARADSTTAYWFGDEAKDLERFGWTLENSGGVVQQARARSVGTRGASPWGLFDMHGNVFEWTFDAQEPYTASVSADDGRRRESVGDAGRVLRGGSWYVGADDARSAYRNVWPSGSCFDDISFRPVQGHHF
ncbi:MAG: formylglycine-generating enzyme family protein [Myxococcales bacterium]|nr:formylglycine-generating enzyme family protein [Myxococcales bacterium]